MPPDDPSAYGGDYNAMMASAGLLPPFAAAAPPTMFPGQMAAQIAQAGMFGFQQPIPTFTGGPQMFPGAGGIMMPMQPGGPASPFAGSPLGGAGPMTPPSIFNGHAATAPPPFYRGPMGQPPNLISPQVPSAYFNTPYQAAYAQQEASEARWFGMGMAGYGAMARTGTDFLGAGAGAALGARFGGAKGAVVGGALGFLGSEFGGIGQAGQNFFMNHLAAPAINMRAYGAGIESLSQGFVAGGAYGSPTGSGFSRGASIQSARMLEDMSNSGGFQRETFGRFNTADVMRIAQGAGQNGLMQGVQSPEEMRDRVRSVSRQLQAFMELANEPDLQRAMQTMGNMRLQGMGLNETMQAVQNGRAFARLAGTTFEQLANVGGGQGAATFGSMGLTQGLGMQAGMANYGLAASAQNLGTLSPQTMNLLGGVGGLANMNNMFSAGMLQLPMLAPGMMTAGGGINANSVAALAAGRTDPMSMTSAGATNLGAMARQMGTGGLGMALGMQPMLQDSIGRMIQAQGPFAQRNMEDRQVMSLARRMGLSGSEGFMTAAQMMGMSGTQAMSRAQEIADPRYFDRQRDQIETRRRERRGVEMREREAHEPGALDTLSSESDTIYDARRSLRGVGRFFRDAYESIAGGGASEFYGAETASERRSMRDRLRSSEYHSHLEGLANRGPGTRSFADRMRMNSLLGETAGGRGIAADLGGFAGGLAMSDRQREAQLLDVQETGRFSAGVLNSSAREQRTAMRSLGQTFGGSIEARDDFGRRLAELYNSPGTMFGNRTGAGAVNAGFRGGAQYLSMGMVDPGNIVGTRQVNFDQLRSAYVQSMRGRSNLSEEALRQQFDDNRSAIAMQAAPRALLGLTDAGRSEMEQQLTRSSRATGPAGDFARSEREAYSGILGDNAGDARSRRAFDSVSRMFGEGFGENAGARTRSRELMTSLAILTRQSQRAGSRDGAQRQIDQVTAEARRRGMSQSDIDEASRRVFERQRDLAGNTDLNDALSRMNMGGSGADVLTRVGRTMQGAQDVANDRLITSGASILGRQRGQLGRLFSGVASGDRFDVNQLRANVNRLSSDELAQLQEQDPETARLVRQMQGGNERQRREALGGILNVAQGQGQRQEGARRRAHELGWGGRLRANWNEQRGFWGGLSNAFNGMFESEEDFATRHAGGSGTRADDAAVRETNDASGMENHAGGAGIGRASDRLLQAAREISEAARNLNGTAQSGQLDSMMGNGT